MKIFEHIHPQNKYTLKAYRFTETFSESPEDFLSASELLDLHDITNETRRRQFLQSRFWLKQNLSQLLNLPPAKIQFKKIGEGKPVLDLENTSVDFNISHSDEICLVGISQHGSIGVDLEKSRRPRHLEKISERFFSSQEKDFLFSLQDPQEQERGFVRLWSGKEALIKAAAGGVFRNVLEVIINCEQWTIHSLPTSFGPLENWELRYFDALDGYIVSAAFRSGND